MKHPVSKRVAKVPVVMQLEALECGAASLCMILAYFGRWIPLEQLRKECGVSRDGSNLRSIYLVAKKYKLKTKAFQCSAESLKEEGTFPCIAFWNFNHFIVVDGFKGGKVYINDPASGEYTLTLEEFEKSYSGVCMLFEPEDDFESGGKPESILKYARERLRGTMPAITLVALTTLIAAFVGMITPAFSRFFVDNILTGKYSDWSLQFFLLLGTLTAFQIISLCIKALYLLKLQGKTAIVANTRFLWHILRLPVEFFEQRMAGDIIQRYASNQGIADTLINTFTPLLLDTLSMILNLCIMMDYSPFIALTGIISVVLSIIAADYISKKRVNITRVQTRDMANLMGTTLQGIDMIETIKSAGAENGFFTRWSGFQANANMQTVKFAKLNSFLGQIPMLLSMLASNIILFMGVRLVINGEWTIGLISAFMGYLTAFQQPAQKLVLAGQQLQEMRTNMERVQDVFKYPVDVNYKSDDASDEEMNKLSGLVEMKNVTFGYNRLDKPLLDDFSLTVEPGKSVALVGASGCGKSTVAKLLTGLYPVWNGEILFDGRKISEINRNVFTGSVASVDQNITLFEDTVANNIRLWDKTIKDFEIILAARDAAVHDEIIQRDGDYSAKLSEGGRNLSGGQRQRIEIARVLAQDPTIIILDEATSALDSKTEYEMMQSVRNRGITRIIISHRLSIIRDCEEIIVMKDGKILDRGTHSELMQRCEYYSELITNE
ncbi:MAG: NHLP family bacteriocin export ABC transporter peptidase/permease/ATPase subunit [Synergistaceae bacterium]|nr:NHLP family bacteriocin export ABC transporter peptidase/permease/ATPase subunit [Synergistaceae bacterium]MBQ9629393.1 NHLP family bacteriocin export ABC transporter peptidase/permease/ATPase subunit [Synergistaceae bacterium]